MSIWMFLQVNLCQKLSFLNQLTHNMTRDCSLNPLKNTSSEHFMYTYCFECQNKNKKTNFCTHHVLNLYFYCNSMNNLSSYCGLTDARMRASEKDIPVRAKRIWDSFFDWQANSWQLILCWFTCIYKLRTWNCFCFDLDTLQIYSR